jgi:TRAP-type C4-dicarboxylate transport system substrate-binding protein
MPRLLRLACTAMFLIGAVRFAAAEETRLIMTSMSPAGHTNSAFFRAWGDRVTKDSQGTLKIEVRDGFSIANYGNVYGRVQDDVVQVGWLIHQFVGGKFPLTDVASLPFAITRADAASVALWRLYKTGLLDKEYEDVVPLFMGVFPPHQLHLVRKPTDKLSDLRGLKIGVNGRTQASLTELLDGKPLSIQTADIYEALQRGTVDGNMVSWSAFSPFRLGEVTSYHVEVPLGGNSSMIFISKKKFASLPDAARKALIDNSGEAQSMQFGTYLGQQGDEARAKVAASPNQVIATLPPDVEAGWRAKATDVRQTWAKDHPGGDEVLATFNKLYGSVN